jgi:hypothetical protein
MRSDVQAEVNVQCDNKVMETEIHNAKLLLPTGEVSRVSWENWKE